MAYLDENYWSQRYLTGTTGWDIGYPSYPLVQYLDQIVNKEVEILIPGAGNGLEAAYAFQNGFKDIHLLDFSLHPLESFQMKFPSFPESHIHHEDFFYHNHQYDLILEQTFFCALDPTLRIQYINKMYDLLKPGGKLVGVLFNQHFEKAGPPFGGDVKEYQSLFSQKFKEVNMEPCYNSIPERQGAELFIQIQKSNT